ncbi:LysR family transcriptional regulator, partial [Stenotrophomonas maltophilia]
AADHLGQPRTTVKAANPELAQPLRTPQLHPTTPPVATTHHPDLLQSPIQRQISEVEKTQYQLQPDQSQPDGIQNN